MQPLQEQNLELVLAGVLKTRTTSFLLGTLCYFGFLDFFLLFLWPLQRQKTEQDRRGPVETLVHMLYYAHLHTCPP